MSAFMQKVSRVSIILELIFIDLVGVQGGNALPRQTKNYPIFDYHI